MGDDDTISVALLRDLIRKKNDRSLTLAQADHLRFVLGTLESVSERVVDGRRVELDAAQTEFVTRILSTLLGRGCPKLDEVMAVFGLSPATVFVDPSWEQEIGFDLGH